ncbi:FAD-dependent oxidoreductase, partial [Paenibacillus xylanexedens]|uniref:FAD-dependent oxidoreductase n=1 Tax=Paenibacillus xylanexedens TaxID=528191 RepID=UPI001C92C4D8
SVEREEIINDNVEGGGMLWGVIEGRGGGYWGWIEDKIVGLSDKGKDEILVEGEGKKRWE